MSERNQLTIESTKLKIKAAQNPSTVKPSTRYAASIITATLITSVKSPKVMIVMGRANNLSIGFKRVFSIPKMIEAMRAIINDATSTPGVI